MLLNLGLPANTAAAHESDLVVSNPVSQRSSPVHGSSRPVCFATLPLLGLDDLYNRYRGVPPGKLPPTDQPAMSGSSVDSLPMSDANHSTVGPGLARPRIGRAQTHSVRKQSSRAKTSYQLAHPAGHARHRRLKLRPKLLLQVQRVSPTSRPLPVLDVLPSSVFLPRLARKFPAIFRGKKGLGPNDLIVVASDLYEPAGGRDIAERQSTSDDESGEHREVIATICQLLKENALSQGKTEICLRDGPVWEATPLSNGSYEFVAHTEQGIQTVRWVVRNGRNRRVSAPPGSTLAEDGRRFTFSVIDPTTRRHPVLASMARNHLEVFHEYSMPSSAGSTAASPTSGMSVVSDLSEADIALDRQPIPVDDYLRKLIIVTSIWVAMREGWSHSFRYDDSALALNPKAICGSRHDLPMTPQNENEPFPKAQIVDPDGLRIGLSSRRPTSSTLPPSLSVPNSPVAYGRLNKRSNSTGAAFIERSNRRASGIDNGPNRHSGLCSPRGVSQNRNSESNPAVRAVPAVPAAPATNGQTRSQRKKTDSDDRTPQSGAHSGEASRSIPGRAPEPEPTKGKCRRRLSHVFDCLVRRNSHRH
ncbi:hypothetical protein P168DRAFT_186972 [Aspergillus campestris IBT 28561]|uniref:Uncharacterized protein n=1 Tax=Aspergillus campestris (strain IBT 28561) TaxID=1392248 RepID=A0A2I1CYA7_ASPC2|nr:uncharacterized protein P168DRAFT_186972 [Aspergillus campestris IBT 28561]PKY02592.1 hypothetical protein P168DRAFT_186972 [Aspergillus campestris IBT 28561]